MSTQEVGTCSLERPCRNNYYFGKLLDVQHFRMETEYFNSMRRLRNRLLTGCGVVCGLDVRQVPAREDAVYVLPGFALDCCGREIIVDRPSPPIPLGEGLQGLTSMKTPPREWQKDPDSGADCDDVYVHVVLCYHECPTDPQPVLAGDVCDQEACQPSVICEAFRVEVRPGCAPEPRGLGLPDVIRQGRLDRELLVRALTEPCPPCPEDCCIPLANIRVKEGREEHSCRPDAVDITIRPIVFSNQLLHQLILSQLDETPLWKRD